MKKKTKKQRGKEDKEEAESIASSVGLPANDGESLCLPRNRLYVRGVRLCATEMTCLTRLSETFKELRRFCSLQPKSEEDPADFTTCHLGLSFRARYNALIGVRVVVDRFLLKVVGVVN